MQHLTDRKLIHLTQELLSHFYSRQIQDDLHYLSDDFMWIGAFDYQYTLNKEQFLTTIKSELDAVPFIMRNEEFQLLYKDKSVIVIYGKFKLHATTKNHEHIRTHTRLTIVWKYIDHELKLIHIHGSNAQDIPLAFTQSKQHISPKKDFFKYLTSLELMQASTKIAFRDINGIYKYFLPDEILFIEANLQHSILVTNDNEIVDISGILSSQVKKLPSYFYRIHKSYLVNVNYIKSVERYALRLDDDTTLPISKNKYLNLKGFLDSH